MFFIGGLANGMHKILPKLLWFVRNMV